MPSSELQINKKQRKTTTTINIQWYIVPFHINNCYCYKKTVSCCHKLTKTATLSCWEEGGGLCPEDANSNTLSYVVTEMVSLACIKPITGLKMHLFPISEMCQKTV